MQVNIESIDFVASMSDDGKVTYKEKPVMDRFDIIDQLEGKYIQMPNLKWHQVKDRSVEIDGRIFPMRQYSSERLEKMLESSISETSVRIETAYRLLALHSDKILTDDEQEAMDWFSNLPRDAQIAQIKFRYQDWKMDQQRELARVGGW